MPEVAALIERLRTLGRDPLVVDAAAGRAPVGLIAAALLGWRRLVVIEQDPDRAASARRAAARLPGCAVEVRVGPVEDPGVWPERPDAVVALHACGPASDAVLDATVSRRVQALFLVPCCTAHTVRASPLAHGLADAMGVPTQPAVRRRFVQSVVDSERTLRLEAAGYAVKVAPLVPPTVTPHNLIWQARHVGSRRRMQAAAARLERLHRGSGPGES